MLWFWTCGLGVAGLIVVTVLAARVRRELSPTLAIIDRFGRAHRVELTRALERLGHETAQTRRRLSGD